MRQNNRETAKRILKARCYWLNGVTVEPNFPCYCDTCDTYEKVVRSLLKSIDTEGKPSDNKAKRHGLLTNEIEQPYY